MTRHNFVLRPVTMNDAQDIYDLRVREDRGKYLNPINMESHLEWLKARHNISNDYYFAVQNEKNEVHGYIGLYNIKFRNAEWGRWIMKPNSPAVFISYHLILKFAFSLELKSVYCKTSIHNRNALRIHDSLPYSFRDEISDSNFVQHILKKRDWNIFEKAIARYSRINLA
jgi:RimJ/RimL family protein N-acetyltransferase